MHLAQQVSAARPPALVIEAFERGSSNWAEPFVLLARAAGELAIAPGRPVNESAVLKHRFRLGRPVKRTRPWRGIRPLEQGGRQPYRAVGGRPSAKEEEVLRPVVLGYTNGEIASQLSASRRTVETHRPPLMQKRGRRTRTGLVDYAIEAGLVHLLWPAASLDPAPGAR